LRNLFSEIVMPDDTKKQKILIVDDEQDNIRILAEVLKGKYRLIGARNGELALKCADSEETPDLILLDIMMPGMDGYEVIRKLKDNPKTQDIPVIFVTAMGKDTYEARGLELGAVDYITKPVNPAVVLARVSLHLELSYYRDHLEHLVYRRTEELANTAKRIRKEVTDRKQAEEELRKHKDHLEEMVEKRTSELKAANEQLKKEIEERKRVETELQKAKDYLEKLFKKAETARRSAEAANNKIIESIRYAKMIQTSLMPNPANMKEYLSDSFFIWKPRDIVGGDIIFADAPEYGYIIAVIDCTGHGVPGAFMTMIASSSLKRIVKDEGCFDPGEILKRLNFIVKTTLHQDTDYALSNDGMDAAVCYIKPKISYLTSSFGLTFAGARLPLYYVFNGQVNVIKGDRQSIGYKRCDLNHSFANQSVKIEKGMAFYMASDGFADQMGGERRRRFGSGRFRQLLKKCADMPFDRQREAFLKVFNVYKGDHEIQDDITVVGFGFNE